MKSTIRGRFCVTTARQRGLFAAAWSVGFVAHFAKCGASAITLGEAVGELGIVYGKTDYSQPWFDENGGVYPVCHAVKALPRCAAGRVPI